MLIEVKVGEADKALYRITSDAAIVGRSKSCDITVKSNAISRQHIRIEQKSGDILVTDLGSSNGTFINGQQIAANQPTAFTTFFPINIGTNIIITLVDETVEIDENMQIFEVNSSAAPTADSTPEPDSSEATAKPAQQKKRVRLSQNATSTTRIEIPGAKSEKDSGGDDVEKKKKIIIYAIIVLAVAFLLLSE